jgi:hypothetical protein
MLRWPLRGIIRFGIDTELTGQPISATARFILQPSTKHSAIKWLAD